MPTNEEKAFWNSHEITSYFESKPPDPNIVSFLVKHSLELQGAVALDLGCGGGRHSEILALHGLELHGIDINIAMVETTNTRLSRRGLVGNIEFGTILNIPHANETFNLIVSTGVLHQAKSSEEYNQALDEIARVIKPAGYILLNIFSNMIWDETYTPLNSSNQTVLTKEGLTMTLLSSDDFNNRMNERGLILIDSQGEELKQENTGPRAVYRAFYQKVV